MNSYLPLLDRREARVHKRGYEVLRRFQVRNVWYLCCRGIDGALFCIME